MKLSLFAMLRKADAPENPETKADKPDDASAKVRIADMVEQAKPKNAKDIPPATYEQRFTVFDPKIGMATPLTMPRAAFDKIITNQVEGAQKGNLFHHVGYKGPHTYHVLSTSQDPEERGIAGIITGVAGGQRHIRGAFSGSFLPMWLEKLKGMIQSDPNYSYTEDPITLDQTKHAEKGWEQHNADLFHGLAPDVSVVPNDKKTATSWISFAAKPGESVPRAVAKEALNI